MSTNAELYQMPVRAIKNILKKELEQFKNNTLQVLHKEHFLSDVPKEMIYLAYSNLLGVLDKCQDYAALEDYISYAGYRMSLTEWINSL